MYFYSSLRSFDADLQSAVPVATKTSSNSRQPSNRQDSIISRATNPENLDYDGKYLYEYNSNISILS